MTDVAELIEELRHQANECLACHDPEPCEFCRPMADAVAVLAEQQQEIDVRLTREAGLALFRDAKAGWAAYERVCNEKAAQQQEIERLRESEAEWKRRANATRDHARGDLVPLAYPEGRCKTCGAPNAGGYVTIGCPECSPPEEPA